MGCQHCWANGFFLVACHVWQINMLAWFWRKSLLLFLLLLLQVCKNSVILRAQYCILRTKSNDAESMNERRIILDLRQFFYWFHCPTIKHRQLPLEIRHWQTSWTGKLANYLFLSVRVLVGNRHFHIIVTSLHTPQRMRLKEETLRRLSVPKC